LANSIRKFLAKNVKIVIDIYHGREDDVDVSGIELGNYAGWSITADDVTIM
jgi:hypothetical protein